MARGKPFGTCRLCGEEDLLSFEHVPPRVTFNASKVVEKSFQEYIGPGSRDWDEPPDGRGKQRQRGNGGHWLCRACNSFLGREYVPYYAEFVHEIVRGSSDGTDLVKITVCIKRVLKQIVAMFCAINKGGPEWPAVVRFARDPACSELPEKYRLFFFRCRGPSIHLYGFQAWLDLKRPGSGATMISEITHTPMGFHLLYGHGGEHNPRMVEITDWVKHSIDDLHEIGLVAPVLPAYSPMFNDFRTPREMRRDRRSNESHAALRGMGWWLPET